MPIDCAASGRANEPARMNVPTMILLRSSRDGRRPARRPPTSDPAEKPASAMPARARLPSPSAKAGTAISTAPNPSPSQTHRRAIVLTPTAERAPRRELCRLLRRAGRAHRWQPREGVGPDTGEHGSARDGGDRVDRGEDGDEQRAADEDHLLERCVEGVRRAGAVHTRDDGPDRAQHGRDRRHRQPGGGSGDGDRGDRRLDLTEHRDEAEKRREQDHPAPEHEPRAAPVDLAAPVRGSDRDCDPVGGSDETRRSVARPRSAHEQHERQRRHALRQPGDDAPGEQRCRVLMGEELAVARDPPRLGRVRHAQEGWSAAAEQRPGSIRGPLPAMLEPVDDDHLDRAGDGDRSERADHAGELGAHQHGHEHDQRRQPDGAAVDERLEHVVLELLVEDEEDHEHDARGRRMEKADGADDDRRQRRPGERDQIEQGDDQAERDRVRDAEHEQHGRSTRRPAMRLIARLPVT